MQPQAGNQQQMIEELAQLLEQNPDEAEAMLTELSQTHPEIADLLAKYAGGWQEGAAPVQNAAAAFAGPTNMGGLGPKKPAAYDAQGRPLYYADEEPVQDAADNQSDIQPLSHPSATGSATDSPQSDPKADVGGQLDEAMGKIPPPGFEEWAACLEHAMATHPALAGGEGPEAEGPPEQNAATPAGGDAGYGHNIGGKVGKFAGGALGALAGGGGMFLASGGDPTATVLGGIGGAALGRTAGGYAGSSTGRPTGPHHDAKGAGWWGRRYTDGANLGAQSDESPAAYDVGPLTG